MSNFRGFGPGGHHYDPNQPRVPAGDPSHHGGRWTDGGVELASGSSAAIGARGAGAGGGAAFSPHLVPLLRDLLSRLPDGPLGRTIFLSQLLVSAIDGLTVDGVLPGHPDIVYRYNQGYLTLWQNVPGPNKPLLFHGPAGADGLYRLPGGAVIGRDLGDGVLLNEVTIGGEKRRVFEQSRTDAAVANDNVKLCPNPVPDHPSTKAAEDDIRWKLYQQQITGLKPGLAVMLNGRWFDGCRTTDGVMLEAKGEGFAWAFEDGKLKYDHDGIRKMVEQMHKQSEAAAIAGKSVEWHVAEKPLADYLTSVAASLPHKNVTVINTPPMYVPNVR